MSNYADDIEAERLRLEYRLAQLETQDKARNSFIDFVRYVWPDAILGEHHKRMADAFDRVANGTLKRLIINLGPRHALVTSMRIPTTHGFKAMADLRPGDQVFGPDGLPTVVLGKSEVFRGREIYRVWTDDGAYLDVDGEHLWSVRLNRRYPKLQDYTTEQLWRRQNGESLRTTRDGRAIFIEGCRVDPTKVRAPRLPDIAPVQYPQAQLPVDPYVLGLWLGDGTANHAIITSEDKDMVVIRPEVERRGFRTTDQTTRMTFGVLGLKVKLRELGVLGNKHIPALYMTASEQQRRDLLRGLMDSDGNVAKHGQCFFAQSNRALCEQVQQLVRSLGVKASLLESRAVFNGRDYGPTWKVSFYASDVFFLPRKEVRTLKNERTFGRYIRIEKLGITADTQCIKVDRADGLFLAGEGYICTHNTKSEFGSYLFPAYVLGRGPRLQIIEATHTAELAVKFGRKVRDLVDSSSYKELFPDVALKQDSKAAGRWDTNRGGSYFAVGVGGAVTGRGADLCVDPNGMVQTPVGEKRAGDVRIGDELLGVGGYGRVRHVITSEHQRTVVINDDLRVSEFHPVWVMGRGWVDAKDVKVGESLYNPHKGIYNSSIAQIGGISDVELQSRVSNLESYAPALRQPERCQLQQLRGAWHSCLRKMGEVCQLLARHGACAISPAYAEPQGQRGYVLPRELRMGVSGGSTKQPTRQRVYRGFWPTKNTSAVGTCDGADSGHDQAPYKSDGHDPRASAKGTEDVPQPASRGATKFGWAGGRLLRIISRGAKAWGLQQASSASCTGWQSKNLCWIPVEVRSTRTEHHEPRTFVNFHVEGSNTYVYNSYLTHNCIIDDPHSEQDAQSDLALENAWDWYQSGPRTRLQPGGAVVLIMTRWGTRDLTARLLKAQKSRNADQWEVIELPAILPSGKPLWPEFWKIEELEAVRSSLSVQKWNAMYQQQPTNDEGAILKREWWRVWQYADPPEVNYIIQTLDTAYSKNETADFSVIATWGVFYPNEDSGANIILLDVFRKRMDFPELKRVAKEQYDHWQPDNMLIEAKATGTTLQQELRRMNIPVTMYSPGGRRAGQDKVSRAHSVAPILESGIVWAPDTDWAEELVEECAAFPNGDNDDLVDVTTMALMRFRQGNFVTLGTDADDDDDEASDDGIVPEFY